jgi:signal transduction histidine kinase
MRDPREVFLVEEAVNADERRSRAPPPSPVEGSHAASIPDAENSARRQEALIQAGLALASELSLPAVLQKIIDLACEVADAKYGALGVLGQGGRLRDFITCGVTEEERRAIGDLPVGEGILGVLITDAYPLRLQRIQDAERSVGFPANHPPMTSFLGVPVSVRGKVYGNLYLTDKRDVPEFTADDERAVVTLAALASVAIENARLFAEAQERLAMEARHRLARELHDSVSQALFSMTLETRAAQLALQREGTDPSGDMSGRLARLQQLTENALAEMRALIFELRPEALREEGLAAAIRQHAQAVAARADLIIEVETVDGGFALPPDIEEEIYRTAQEALTNVVKHADASHGRITLLAAPGAPRCLLLEISDDGIGFDPARSRPGHLGLTTMRQRVERLGGRLDVHSTPDGGTTIQALVPVPAGPPSSPRAEEGLT